METHHTSPTKNWSGRGIDEAVHDEMLEAGKETLDEARQVRGDDSRLPKR